MTTQTTDPFKHSHCPKGCEHPQPFADDLGNEYCGRCYWTSRILTKMIKCVPETCQELMDDEI